MGGAGIGSIFPGLTSDYIGIPLAVILCAWNYFTKKKDHTSTKEADTQDTLMAHSGAAHEPKPD
jgi:hypothetical protein